MARRKTNIYSSLIEGESTNFSYTPQRLWKKAQEYIKWTEDNPLKEEKVFSSGKRLFVSKMRVMSITGFCVFAHITKKVLTGYEQIAEYEEVINKIKDIIFIQKFEGAAAGLLETGFIVRELGLKEQTDITTNGKSIQIEFVNKKTQQQLEELQRKFDLEQ